MHSCTVRKPESYMNKDEFQFHLHSTGSAVVIIFLLLFSCSINTGLLMQNFDFKYFVCHLINQASFTSVMYTVEKYASYYSWCICVHIYIHAFCYSIHYLGLKITILPGSRCMSSHCQRHSSHCKKLLHSVNGSVNGSHVKHNISTLVGWLDCSLPGQLEGPLTHCWCSPQVRGTC